jgi:hypothetical protein
MVTLIQLLVAAFSFGFFLGYMYRRYIWTFIPGALIFVILPAFDSGSVMRKASEITFSVELLVPLVVAMIGVLVGIFEARKNKELADA